MLEFLLVNHPLDCPVCDKGGECPLQDQTLAYGPGESRFVEEKRHWEKPIPISDLVYLDRERCIQCGRCVRFADEVAGDRPDRLRRARRPDRGRHLPGRAVFVVLQRQRGADLPGRGADGQAVPFQGPAVGPRAGREHVHDLLGRVPGRPAVELGRADPPHRSGLRSGQLGLAVRQGPLRFRRSSSPKRIAAPLVRRGDELVEVSWAEALAVAAAGWTRPKRRVGVARIGGDRWVPPARTRTPTSGPRWPALVFETDNVDAQLGDGLPAETVLGLPRATIDQAAAAPLVMTLGPDIKDELAVLYLRLRHAVRENGTQLIELTPAPTGLSPYAAETAVYRPGEVARLAAALVGAGPVTGDVAGVPLATIEAVRAHIEQSGKSRRPRARRRLW